MKRTTRLVLAAAWLGCGVANAQQEAFPSRRIVLAVPFGAGSGIDQLGRGYAEVLRGQLNQPVVIENREGAAGVIGSTAVARAPADGYTILLAAHPPFAIAPLLQKEPGYDPIAGFAPVAGVGSVPLIAVTASSTGLKSWQEMTASFRANPEKANYAVSGTGSPGQLFTQLIRLQTGLPMQEISYKSTAQAMTDTLSGQVQLSLVSIAAAVPHIKAGTLRALAVGSEARQPSLADVPTIAESIGRPGFEASVWYGFLVPAGTPADRVSRLHAEIAKASADPRIVEIMNRGTFTQKLESPQQFAASIREAVGQARKMIEAARIGAQ